MCSRKAAKTLDLLQACACAKPLRCYELFWHDGPGLVKTSYRQVSNIRCTLVVNKIVDNSDVVGALPVGAAPTTSSLST